ncbi:MAG: HD domain-containing protein, partial [Candidatus Zixiibacteriota bacterium]
MQTLSMQVVNEILSRGRIYEVGGAVRDRFLVGPEKIKDRDYLVTGIPYDDLARMLKRFGRVELVGRSFGVIKFTQFHDDKPVTFDISLPRREHSTGVGHTDFAVDFDPALPVEEDLVRRDFTINAMALALDDETLVDPLGGKRDIEHKVLRMTSEKSFEEDPLRMMRAVQFAARFEFTIEPDTLQSMTAHAHLIDTISAERIAEEFNKLLLLARRPSIGFRLMLETGLLKHVLPELETCVGVDQPGGYHRYDVFEHTIRAIDAAPPRLSVRLAALFHDITKPKHKRPSETGATFYGHEVSGARVAAKVLKRLRYSKDLIADVVTLVERHMFTTDVSDKGRRRLIRRVGKERIFDLLDLRRADVEAQGMGGKTDDVDRFEKDIREEFEKKRPFGIQDLAIGGNEVMALCDLEPSPMVGRILSHLLEHVLDEPEDNTRETLE